MDFADRLRKSAHPELFLQEHGLCCIAGVDEAGRGPLAGPVVAAAVILPPGWRCGAVRDSRKLTSGRRQQLFSLISGQAVAWSWAYASAEEIDSINILQASLRAMARAVARLHCEPEFTLVDGPHRMPAPVRQVNDSRIAHPVPRDGCGSVIRYDWILPANGGSISKF